MNIGDLLGSVLQSGLSQSSTNRIQNSLGGGGILDQLGGLLGGVPGGTAQASTTGGGILDQLGGLLGGVTGGTPQAGTAGAGSILDSGTLGNLLNEVAKKVGGTQNLALGGLGALAGALLGGKKGVGGAIKGGIGGGAMAMLGIVAYQALKRSGAFKNLKVPLGLAQPRTAAEQAELEKNEELVLKAMINAAKSDGTIEESEITRIVGKVQEFGADPDSQAFLKAEMQRPMDTAGLVAAARGRPELAAQLYAASLLAIEVDTPAEKEYLAKLAGSLGLGTEVAQNLHQAVGLKVG